MSHRFCCNPNLWQSLAYFVTSFLFEKKVRACFIRQSLRQSLCLFAIMQLDPHNLSQPVHYVKITMKKSNKKSYNEPSQSKANKIRNINLKHSKNLVLKNIKNICSTEHKNYKVWKDNFFVPTLIFHPCSNTAGRKLHSLCTRHQIPIPCERYPKITEVAVVG